MVEIWDTERVTVTLERVSVGVIGVWAAQLKTGQILIFDES